MDSIEAYWGVYNAIHASARMMIILVNNNIAKSLNENIFVIITQHVDKKISKDIIHNIEKMEIVLVTQAIPGTSLSKERSMSFTALEQSPTKKTSSVDRQTPLFKTGIHHLGD